MDLITTHLEQLIQTLQNNKALWVFSAALLSMIVGSFLNVVISRLPPAMELECQYECRQYLGIEEPEETRNTQASVPSALSWPPSHCPTCKKRLKLLHNIPVISYIFLKGRCAFCSATISSIYPCVELLTAFLGGMVAHVLGASVGAAMGLLFVYYLIALTFIDAKHKILPDSLTLPLLWLGLVVNSFSVFTTLEAALWGAVAGYLTLWIAYWSVYLLTGKQSMGYGDFKLLAALGAWLGWEALPVIVLLSSLAGLIAILVSRALFSRTDPQMPFGPFMAASGPVYLLGFSGNLLF